MLPVLASYFKLPPSYVQRINALRTKREAVIAGLLHWRLHLAVLATSFALFPLIGLGIRPLADAQQLRQQRGQLGPLFALGTVQRLLVEGASKRDGGELMGRTECNRVVNFAGQPRLIGQMVDVRITETRSYSLRGDLLQK